MSFWSLSLDSISPLDSLGVRFTLSASFTVKLIYLTVVTPSSAEGRTLDTKGSSDFSFRIGLATILQCTIDAYFWNNPPLPLIVDLHIVGCNFYVPQFKSLLMTKSFGVDFDINRPHIKHWSANTGFQIPHFKITAHSLHTPIKWVGSSVLLLPCELYLF